ncbi:MAG: hypothetical protein WCL61_03070 [bacterium]
MKNILKTKALWIILSILILIIIGSYFLNFSPKKVIYGVTFSQQYAKDELGLDWKQVYTAILDDLKVDHIRLSAYWNHNEPSQGISNYEDLDWQINEASKRNVKIILAVGDRLPRWPECHSPEWAKKLAQSDFETALLNFVETTTNRYKGNKNIIRWQVENEPFLGTFGECRPLDKNLLKKEIALVKKITNQPIMVSDSGELSTWIPVSQVGGDILGSTLYNVVYNPNIGYWRWFFPPALYQFKAWYIRTFTPVKKVIIAELQAESWHKAGLNLSQMTLKQHFETMTPQGLLYNTAYAKKAGFDEVYLWGAEWWYFMKEKQNYDNYWKAGKTLWP